MSLKNQASKKSSQLTKTIKASANISVTLTDSAFNVLNEAIAKNNHFQTEAQKSQKELSNNLIVAIEGAGYKAEDYAEINLDTEKKTLILTKK